ncbi:hypothetical protein FGU46_00895 [Methanobacterium sp. CWC-01]|uniref:hypothetical protein n=1 Tax=Methanobacterium aridiramus TaxID=2584467 RepID=UPI002575984C|nr:hypothetical protein [Methanobacterium sp. CWC-01]WJI08749.1 hypothetical protein FGU46_00895 [Methanobacterium sp. CWC-01]
MALDQKGLASAELLFITLVALVIFGGMVSLVSSGMEKTETASLAEARIVGEKIANNINSVHINGNGYSSNMTIPADPDITATVNNSTGYLTVVYQGKNIDIKLIPSKIDSKTMTSGHKYRVYNQNGAVKFEDV